MILPQIVVPEIELEKMKAFKTHSKVFLVGTGVGNKKCITPYAKSIIMQVSVIIGNAEALSHIEHWLTGKEVISIAHNPLERIRLAIAKAQEGKDVAIISSGDPSVYAIAATFFDYLHKNNISANAEVVPGISIASYASAKLGAAIGSDCATVSLCDQGTPWSVISRRIHAALSADYVLVIYNPIGKIGLSRWKETQATLMDKLSPNTPIAILSHAGTPDEQLSLIPLVEIESINIPADTLIIVGNSQSYIHNKLLISPRHYVENIGY